MLQSRSLTRSVVMNVRSCARDRSSRIDYWTLNSCNVNSMFAASGWFMGETVTYTATLSQLIQLNQLFCWHVTHFNGL